MSLVLYLIPLLGLVFPRSKKICAIQIAAISLFYGGYVGNIDIDNYIWQYNNDYMTDWGGQQLYSYVSIFFHKMGMPFGVYHLLITFISILIISMVIFKLTSEPGYVLCVIAFFVYAENGWQLKSMLATIFIVLALYWYKEKIYGKRVVLKNILVYLILVFLATQFHFLSLFFIVFLFQPLLAKYFMQVLAGDVLMLLVVRGALPIAAGYIPALSNYMSPISLPSFLVTVVWQILGGLIIYWLASSGGENFLQTSFYLDGTKIMFLLLPFYFYANVATRIYRIWIIFMAIYAAHRNREQLRIEKNRFIFDAYILCSYFFWFILLPVLQGGESIIVNVINNNILNM